MDVKNYLDNVMLPALKEFIEEHISAHYSVGELRRVAARGKLGQFWKDWVAWRYNVDKPIGFDDIASFKDALTEVIEPMLFVWRGEWVAGERYVANDWVSHAGSSYICVEGVDGSGTIPQQDDGHWALLAQSGDYAVVSAANNAAVLAGEAVSGVSPWT